MSSKNYMNRLQDLNLSPKYQKIILKWKVLLFFAFNSINN